MSTSYSIYPRLRTDKHSYKKRGYPIWLRYANKGEKPAFRDTGVVVSGLLDWNDKIKMIVDGPFAKLKMKALEIQIEAAEERVLKAVIKGGDIKRAFKGKILKNFNAYILKHGGQHAASVIKQIKGAFAFGEITPIDMVTVPWLNALEDYMDAEDLGQNSKKAYFTSLSKVCKQAVKDGYIMKSPFGEGLFEIPKKGSTITTYLVEKETDILLNSLFNNDKLTAGDKAKLTVEQYRVLVYAMLGHFAGFRFSDWQQFTIEGHVRGDIIDLVPIKTQEKGTRVIHPIEPDSILEKIINIIRIVGPLDLEYDTVVYHLEKIKDKLEIKASINKTHIFRHSFGYMCAAAGIGKPIAAALMGITVEVVEVYYHLTGEHVREQAKKLGKVKV